VEWVEASGKSLVEAKEAVLDLLGVAEDDAEIVVLVEPKTGLFGRVRGEARVQARVRPVTPTPKRGRRQRPEGKRPGGDKGRGGRGGGAERSDGQHRDGPRDGESSGSSANGTGGGSRNGGRNRSRGGGGGGGGGGGQDRARSPESAGRSKQQKEESMEESLTLEQQGAAAKEFLEGLVESFGFDAEVGVKELDEDTVEIAAVGDDLGLLVGPRGVTLAAVQDLTRTVVQRQSEARTDRILVDVAGYREKRIAALRRFTDGIAEEVRSSGEERVLEPMSPADRKVVHDRANELEGVATRSEGVEPSRYVVIEPAE
jgi:spoIIIJ-associated protein